MEKQFKAELLRELAALESSKRELQKLVTAADRLARSDTLKRSAGFRRQQASRLFGRSYPMANWVSLSIRAVPYAFGMVAVSTILAQASAPSSWLYPLKRWSESALSTVYPHLEENFELRRAAESEYLNGQAPAAGASGSNQVNTPQSDQATPGRSNEVPGQTGQQGSQTRPEGTTPAADHDAHGGARPKEADDPEKDKKAARLRPHENRSDRDD